MEFNEIILERIYERCSKDMNCVEKSINSLPYSKETKKKLMISYIQKYFGLRRFLAETLSKNLFLCLDYTINENECYLKMLEKIEGLPSLLPEDLIIKLHVAVLSLLRDNIAEV